MKTFLTPLQYNEIFSASTAIAINGNINEEISRLLDNRKSLVAKNVELLLKLKQCGCGDYIGDCSCLKRELEGYEFRVKELEKRLEISEALTMVKKINAEATEEKLKIAVEALEEYTDTAYDSHDYTAKDITYYAKEALKKISEGV